MRIVVDDRIPYLGGVLDSVAEVISMPGHAIQKSNLLQTDALLVRTRTLCNADLLQGTPVRFVATATIGTDHLDIPWLEQAQIKWTNAPGCNANGVMQYVVSALLEIAAKQGESLEGKVLGIVGVGHVGKLVASAARYLGMKVLLNDPPRAKSEGKKGFSPLSDLLKSADILTFHVPLEHGGAHPTYRMVNTSFINAMKPNAWIINSSRGEVVDNTALRIALRSGTLGGAILDVWENESTGIDQELLRLVEIATPHIAGYSVEGKANATSQIVSALAQFFDIAALKGYQVPSQTLPKPSAPLILLGSASSEQSALLTAVRQSYSIRTDTTNLRKSPDQFENLRSNYNFRREFSAYRAVIDAPAPALRMKLKGLGFQIS